MAEHPDLLAEALSEQECLRLLGGTRLGRVALSLDALPYVFPVHFALLGRDPVFRTHGQVRRTAALAGNVVCFQADGLESDAYRGWSVQLTGRAELVTGGPEHEAVQDLPRSPLAPDDDRLVRVKATLIRGHHVG